MHCDAQPFDFQGRTLPSWLLSVCVHLGLLILLALVIRSPQARGLPEGDRTVGIALAQVGEQATEYFDQSDASSDRENAAASEAANKSQQDALPAADALAESKLAELALPGSAVSPPADGLVPEVEFVPIRRGGLPSEADINAARAQDAWQRQQRGSRGPATEVSLFGGAAAVGNSFVFVVDRSDSMGRGGLGVIARAKREFQRALGTFEPVHRFQIVAYNHSLAFFGGQRELVGATEPNKQLVGKFMSGLAAFGATNHFLAIMAALHRSPDVVFLLTDGGEPTLSHPQVVQVLKQAQGRTTIHCIQFGRRPTDGEENFMHRLARQTGGSYRYIDVSS